MFERRPAIPVLRERGELFVSRRSTEPMEPGEEEGGGLGFCKLARIYYR